MCVNKRRPARQLCKLAEKRAYAMGGSPQRMCFSIYLDKRYGCTEAHALDPHVFKCLTGKVEPLFVEKTAEMRDAVLSRVRDGDVVVTMGAGSIANLAPELAIPAAPQG